MSGKGESGSYLGYRMMVWTYNLMDLFSTPGRQLDRFDIKPGQTVIDYGCGPGRYLRKASMLVGRDGKVVGADLHPLALEYSRKRIARWGLENVEVVLVKDNRSPIEEDTADRIYALDMFHHVSDLGALLGEFHRIAKPECRLFLEDGHQPREATLGKLSASVLWKIRKEEKDWVQLEPS